MNVVKLLQVIDKHLQILSKQHVETKFIKVEDSKYTLVHASRPAHCIATCAI